MREKQAIAKPTSSPTSSTEGHSSIALLCRADNTLIQLWLVEKPALMWLKTLPLLILSCACYGFTLGLWHGVEMASYIAIKFPLVILVTLLITALINGITAMISGTGISLRQSLQFLTIGFTIFALILAALSPITFFLGLASPGRGELNEWYSYRVFLTTNVIVIALAGVMAFKILLRHLRDFAITKRAGTVTFFCWLAINFFTGAQVTYMFRPFIGSPYLEPKFFREDMFRNNFMEAIHTMLTFP